MSQNLFFQCGNGTILNLSNATLISFRPFSQWVCERYTNYIVRGDIWAFVLYNNEEYKSVLSKEDAEALKIFLFDYCQEHDLATIFRSKQEAITE